MDLRTHKPKHRHFIAVPILLMGFGFLYGIVRTFATNELPSSLMHIQAEEPRIVSGIAGLKVQLETGTDVTFSLKEPTLTFHRGSSILTTPSLLSIHLGNIESLSVVGGSIFLAATEDNTIIIVPIDAAAILRTASASVLVPAYTVLTLDASKQISLTPASLLWLSEIQDQITALVNTQCTTTTCTVLPMMDDCLPQDCPLRVAAIELQKRATLDTLTMDALTSLPESSELQVALALHLLLSSESIVIDNGYLHSFLQQQSLTEFSRTILSLSLARNTPLNDAMIEILRKDLLHTKNVDPETQDSLRSLSISAANLASERGLVGIQSELEELAASWQ